MVLYTQVTCWVAANSRFEWDMYVLHCLVDRGSLFDSSRDESYPMGILVPYH